MIYDKPIFFEKNRVYRTYKGGKLMGEFLGDETCDGNYPEEWIASAVEAKNSIQRKQKEGISKVKDSDFYLDDLIDAYPHEILGEKKDLGVLIKFLDSSVRLPVQAHPDKEFSMKYFNSSHGKEESWIILATRPGGCVYFGFKEGVTREMFSKAVDDSKTDMAAMEKLLIRHDVKPGDVIFVPAKTVHAIGAGCLILEVQEPTDFTIQPEHWCDGIKLSEKDMYMGLDKETSLDCFKYAQTELLKFQPAILDQKKGFRREMLIGKNQTDNFGVNKITIEIEGGSYMPEISAGVYVILSGSGEVFDEESQHSVKQGDYFLLPHNAVGKCKISGNMTVAECFGL